MAAFYAFESLANTNVSEWYEGNFAKYLYPNAGLDSRRISEFLKRLGKEENYRAFFHAHAKYVMGHVDSDKGVLVNSAWMQNNISSTNGTVRKNPPRLREHLMLVFIAVTFIKMLQDDLKCAGDTPMNIFLNFRNQKCKVYNTTIITAEPVKKVNDIYKKIHIACPPKFKLNRVRLEGDTRFVKSNAKKGGDERRGNSRLCHYTAHNMRYSHDLKNYDTSC